MTEAVKQFMDDVCPVAISSPSGGTRPTFHSVALVPTARHVAIRGGGSEDYEEVRESAQRLREWLEDLLELFEQQLAARQHAARGEGKE